MIRPEAKLSAQALAPNVPKKRRATVMGRARPGGRTASGNRRALRRRDGIDAQSRVQEEVPERFIQVGVHEQFLAANAAGLALAGKMPFVNAYATFCPAAPWEQIRTNICINDVNVKIMGHHTGVWSARTARRTRPPKTSPSRASSRT